MLKTGPLHLGVVADTAPTPITPAEPAALSSATAAVAAAGALAAGSAAAGLRPPGAALDEALRLAASSDYLRAIFESSNDAIIAKTLDGIVTSWNPAATRMFGYRAEQMVGHPITVLFPPDRMDEEALIQQAVLRGQRVDQFQTVRMHRSGKQVHVSATISPICNAAGDIIGATKIARDISPDVWAQEKLWEEQYLDSLTRLPNRRLFSDKLHLALGRDHLEQAPVALLCVNLDRFKEVNESLGDFFGDHLLIQAASRISGCARHVDSGASRDVVGRLSADEFVVLLPNLDRGPVLREIAEQILRQFREPFRIAEHELSITARIGIAVAPCDGITPEELRQNAEIALREARRLGGDRCQEFNEALRRPALRRARLQIELRSALELRQFELHYQPILKLADQSLRRCEALLRWRHPELGMISPAEFIPLAEESGLIRPIGSWVFRTAVSQALEWQQALGSPIQIAVNLSPVQLLQATIAEVEAWSRLVRDSGLPPGCISCEITEGVAMDFGDETSRRMRILRDAGIEVAIDDFGLGYFSFSALVKLEINQLKIDKSLIQRLDQDQRTFAACQGMVVMAHSMGWSVVAEGVETEAQRQRVAAIGCDYVQGYLVCRPGHAAAVRERFSAAAAAPLAGS